MKTYDSIESLYRDLEKEVKTELRVIAKKIKADIDKYIDDVYVMFSCAEKFYKVKDLVDEQFYSDIDAE